MHHWYNVEVLPTPADLMQRVQSYFGRSLTINEAHGGIALHAGYKVAIFGILAFSVKHVSEVTTSTTHDMMQKVWYLSSRERLTRARRPCGIPPLKRITAGLDE